jgi:acyl-CoA synthetase (NDP forming)
MMVVRREQRKAGLLWTPDVNPDEASHRIDATERLKRMLKPRSAVFIGGSVLTTAIGYCKANGFSGSLYVVNPFHDEIAGYPCHKIIEDLPEAPDVAFVAVPKELVCETLAALSALGVGGAVCNSAGFSEIEGEGIDRQAGFTAAAGDMPALGPNSPGFANFVDNAAFMQDHFGDHAGAAEGVAVISNGGAFISDMGCAQRSVPMAYLFGMGNQAALNIADVMDVILDDDRVLAVNLYIESLRDVPKLSAAALKAARKGVPVVVVKGGRSTAGQRATQTHTASLAGDQVIASALFQRLGFLEVRNQIEALETLKMLIFTERPHGRRAALATSSGSYAVVGGDAAEMAGLVMPPLDEQTRAGLDELLPEFILSSNPLDVSNGQFFEPDVQRVIYGAFLDGDFDLAVQVMCFPPEGGWDPASWYVTTDAFAKEAAKRGLPCAFVNTLPEALPRKAREAMIANRMAPLMGVDHGMTAIANSIRQFEMADTIEALDDDAILLPPSQRDETGPVRRFDEGEAKHLLSGTGVQVPRSVTCAADSAATANDLAFPVALKALSPNLPHKTEFGAVVLGIQTPSDLTTAIAHMRERISAAKPGLTIGGYLVEEMVTDGVAELMVGVRHNPGIGLSLTLAIGGVAVELVRDTATVLLPAPRVVIADALTSLKLFPLLDGWRGRPRADIAGALNAITAICAFAVSHAVTLIDLEINPLIIRPESHGAVAVDVVLGMLETNE